MTRKRFVKLCMSRGHSRNEANRAAQSAASEGFTYEQGYFAIRVNDGDTDAVEAVQAAAERIMQAVKLFTDSMAAVAKKIHDALPALKEMAERIKAQNESAME